MFSVTNKGIRENQILLFFFLVYKFLCLFFLHFERQPALYMYWCVYQEVDLCMKNWNEEQRQIKKQLYKKAKSNNSIVQFVLFSLSRSRESWTPRNRGIIYRKSRHCRIFFFSPCQRRHQGGVSVRLFPFITVKDVVSSWDFRRENILSNWKIKQQRIITT